MSGLSYSVNGGSGDGNKKNMEDTIWGRKILSCKSPTLNYKRSILCGKQFLPKKDLHKI